MDHERGSQRSVRGMLAGLMLAAVIALVVLMTPFGARWSFLRLLLGNQNSRSCRMRR